MKETRLNPEGAALWERMRENDVRRTELKSGFILVGRKLQGVRHLSKPKRLMFFSDSHIRPERTRRIPGGLCGSWNGAGAAGVNLREAVELLSPDVIVFGGDLISASCCFQESMEMMSTLKAPLKLAVYGNWDKRRGRWFPFRAWADSYERSGFRLLVNESCAYDGIRFTGLDDFKLGSPEYETPRANEKEYFNCVISHNPDSIPYCMTARDVAETDLILCGHTHGGQIRIPFYGALATSSVYRKRFEYGAYRGASAGARMFVSSGIGATFIYMRVNAPPEILWFDLMPNRF